MTRTRCLVPLLVLALAAPAAAHSRTALDPDDSPGPLDVVAARMKHREGLMKLRLVTYEEWTNATISGDRDFVSFEIDTPESAGIDRCVVVQLEPTDDASPTGVHGTVYRDCNAPLPYGRPVGTPIRVWRPDAHGIAMLVDLDVLWEKRPASFSWRALTSYEEEGHESCAPPDPMPPEHFVGTCADWTAWDEHVVP